MCAKLLFLFLYLLVCMVLVILYVYQLGFIDIENMASLKILNTEMGNEVVPDAPHPFALEIRCVTHYSPWCRIKCYCWILC